ncbi:MAG: TetR/AcrR family transcriptional regulator, partial [Deltaproteobacteria bacterium]|nr:TetR/AcrR family transcriptional regulator [Deltaproteobacteria bacterium]
MFETRGTDLRSRITHAATQLFATRGYAGTSMREVAEAARCTKPALYYYFDNKAALFLQLIHDETERIAAILEEQLLASGSVRERIRLGMHRYLDHIRKNRTGLNLLQRSDMHPEHDQPAFDFRSSRQMFIDIIMRLLEEGVQSCEIRKDLTLEDAAVALIGCVDQRCMRWVLDDEEIPIDYPERVLSL